MLLRLTSCIWQTLRLLRSALPCEYPHIVAALHDAARRVKAVPPRLLVSLDVDTPTEFAFGSGIIVLPQSETTARAFLSGAAPLNQSAATHSRWVAILCHELAHIRRRDGLSRLAAEIAMVLLPWQPLLWLLRRGYLRYSEEACDDWAVVAGADPIEFASLLLDLLRTKHPLLLGATIMNTDVKPRIRRLLSLSKMPCPSTGWLARAAITFVACITIVGVALAQRNAEKAPLDERPNRNAADMKKSGKVPSVFVPTSPPRYILEPPDIVSIEVIKLLPKGALKIEKRDHLEIRATGTLSDDPIRATYVVDEDGEVNLGPEYGRVHVDGLTVKEAIRRIEEHLAKTLKQPRVSLSVVQRAIEKHVGGIHSIGPDGFVSLGAMGQVQIAGMTIDEARQAIEKHLGERFDKPSVAVELHTSNSKVYYVIVEGIEAGDNIARYPITGNETVLDALTQAHGLARFSGKTGWIMRPSASGKGFQVLKVKLDDIVQGRVETNHRVLPGDRIFIREAEVPSQ
jgi:polysaccharide export outer membrane protein